MFFEISGSSIQSETMFFDSLSALEHHRNDPWWNWETLFFLQNFDFSDPNFFNFLKSFAIKWNPNLDPIAEFWSFYMVLLRKKKKIQRRIHLKSCFFKSELSRINFRWRPNFPSLAILDGNQEECFAPFLGKTSIRQKRNIQTAKAHCFHGT